MKSDHLIGHIYVLLFPSGKKYVGQTIQTIEKRLAKHFTDVKRGCTLPIHNAMRGYGKEGMTIEKVFTLRCTQEYLDLVEVRAIKYYNTLAPNGYNLTEGGHGGAKSEETKVKISAAMKGRTGKCHSEESKAKISASKMGHPGYWKGKQGPNKGRLGTMTGKHHSEETKTKMAVAKRGRPSPLKGRQHSEETKAKLRGRCFSEEHKANISIAKRWKPWSLARKLSVVNRNYELEKEGCAI